MNAQLKSVDTAPKPLFPNLAGVATENLVDKVGGGSFQARYINWARTMHLLHEHAPGWLPELVTNENGGLIHRAAIGGYLLIRFRNGDTVTPAVPQAIMDNKNNAVPLERIDARDVTDTHVRGICKAAALTFGLAYELWAKVELESGYAPKDTVEQIEQELRDARDLNALKAVGGVLAKSDVSPEDKERLRALYSERQAQFKGAA